jgi:hypothetical protein
MKFCKLILIAILATNLLISPLSTIMASNYKMTELSLKKAHVAQNGPSNPKPIPKNEELIKLTKEEISKEDLPDMPIYYQGWIKYFKYMDEVNAQKPKHFFKNTQFDKQIKEKTESDKVIL